MERRHTHLNDIIEGMKVKALRNIKSKNILAGQVYTLERYISDEDSEQIFLYESRYGFDPRDFCHINRYYWYRPIDLDDFNTPYTDNKPYSRMRKEIRIERNISRRYRRDRRLINIPINNEVIDAIRDRRDRSFTLPNLHDEEGEEDEL